jgi:multimeric flavodoxin WrbA
MIAKVIGFSGSPIPDSNTDRAVKKLLESTGLEYEFIKLSDYNVRPCMACKLCVDDNICKVDDDFPGIAEKIKKAGALVFGAYSPYGSVDAWTKALMERLWSLRHNTNLLGGKLSVTVTTGGKQTADRVSEMVARQSRMEHMELVGQVTISGNVPCLTCGSGDICEMSGVRHLREKGIKASSDLCVRVEDQESWAEVQRIGKEIGERLG